MKNRILGLLLMMTTGIAANGQGTKLSSFPIAASIDTNKMKFVIVYNSGGSYIDEQLSMGQFASYLNGTYSSTIGAGYGLTYTSLIFKLDSATVYPACLSTLTAGYGLTYSGRAYRADTGTLFPKVSSTFAAGYGLALSSRTYKEDTGTTFAAMASTYAAGYGLSLSGRIYKEDTGTTFAKITSTLAAGYGVLYSSRTFKEDTGTTFPAIRATINAIYGPQNTSASSYTTSVTLTSIIASETSNVNYDISAQAGDLLFNNPSGSWANHQILIVSVKDNGTIRNLTYGTNFVDCINPPITKQASTVVGQTLEQEYRYHSSDGKFYLEGQTSH